MIPGTYSVQARRRPDSRSSTRRTSSSALNNRCALDLALQIGEITQTVEVRTEVPLIEFLNASQGQVLDNKQLRKLPFGRAIRTECPGSLRT